MPSHLRREDEPGDVHFWTISSFRRLTFFQDDGVKRVLCDGLRGMQEKFGICLIGYVIMPEHVHVLLYPHPRGSDQPVKMSRLLQAFKQHTGFYGKARLRDVWCQQRRLWSAPLMDWAYGRYGDQAIWTERGHDGNLRTHEDVLARLDYCHKNPVARELVRHPEEWAWSSWRFYERGDRSVLAMDWDGSWPIVW